MKCLSIKQPFADLVVSGKKTIEIRSWKTNYRGELLIHASRYPDKYALKRFGVDEKNIQLGRVIGKVNLVDCKVYTNEWDFLRDRNLHLAEEYKADCRYGFVFENPVKLKTPLSLKGKLGIFNV
ncbi:MAG: ASCH domain-containing protein, partial [Caldisphaera sp.]